MIARMASRVGTQNPRIQYRVGTFRPFARRISAVMFPSLSGHKKTALLALGGVGVIYFPSKGGVAYDRPGISVAVSTTE